MVTKDHESDLANLAKCNDTNEYYCNKDKDQEEEEDTLSLCDLSSYNDSFKWEKDFSSSENDNNNEDFFEFFSEDYFTLNPSDTDKTNIIFCGKIIPYRGQQHQPRKMTKPSNDNDDKSLAPLDESRLVVRMNDKSKVVKKPKWYLYVFGMVKLFPAPEYELRDLRTRQSRRWRARSLSSLSLSSSDDSQKSETTEDKNTSFSGKNKKRSGFWGLLRALRRSTQ